MPNNKRMKKEYPDDFKTKFGIATQAIISVAGGALMSVLFMVYLTDYAGIGPWGATLATAVLLVGRIFDALNDPFQGWIMDSAKVTKTGKYKKFIIASIVITTVSLILLYNMPDIILVNPVLIGIWVVFFYFAYDVGISFNAFVPFIQTLSNDDGMRAKFFTIGRVVGAIGAIPMGLLLNIALVIGSRTGNIKSTIGLLVFASVIIVGAISLLGIILCKEGPHGISEKVEEKVTFHEIFEMLKTNKVMGVQILANVFFGFTWTISFAVSAYYIKWAYCADLETGIVDNDRLALYTTILGASTMLPVLLATPFSSLLIRKVGSNVKANLIAVAIPIIPCIVIYILHIAGILGLNFFIFFGLMLIVSIGTVGLTFVPSYNIWVECIDYNRYMTGKGMGALVNAARSLLEKGQAAIAGAIVGVMLISVGYNVDSVTGYYSGDLSKMPILLNNLAFLMGIVPAVLATIAFFIYKNLYPITPELKAMMKEKFDNDMALAETEFTEIRSNNKIDE